MSLPWEGHLVMVPEEVEVVPGPAQRGPGEAEGQSWLLAVVVPRSAHSETG